MDGLDLVGLDSVLQCHLHRNGPVGLNLPVSVHDADVKEPGQPDGASLVQRIRHLVYIFLIPDLKHPQSGSVGDSRFGVIAHLNVIAFSAGADILFRYNNGVYGERLRVKGDRVPLSGLFQNLRVSFAIHMDDDRVGALSLLIHFHHDGDGDQRLYLLTLRVSEGDVHGMDPVDGDIFTFDSPGDIADGSLVLDIRHFHGGSLGERAFIRRDLHSHGCGNALKALGRVWYRHPIIHQVQDIAVASLDPNRRGFKGGFGGDEIIPILKNHLKKFFIILQRPVRGIKCFFSLLFLLG